MTSVKPLGKPGGCSEAQSPLCHPRALQWWTLSGSRLVSTAGIPLGESRRAEKSACFQVKIELTEMQDDGSFETQPCNSWCWIILPGRPRPGVRGYAAKTCLRCAAGRPYGCRGGAG